MYNCLRCNRIMSGDEAALYKRLVNRGATDNFLCIECLAENMRVSVSDLEEKNQTF